jgi:hypothetical protein
VKTDRFASVALGAATLVMAALGILGVVNPEVILGPWGIKFPGASALNEIRAGFGSLHVVLAGFYGYAVFHPKARGHALGLLVAQTAALLVTRAVSVAIDGAPTTFVFGPASVEALLLILGTIALVSRVRMAKRGEERSKASNA